MKAILEGYAPREEKRRQEKNQSETTPKSVTGRENYGSIDHDILLNVVERRQEC